MKGINLTIQAGEVATLIGANGAGKSTLLKSILGLHHGSQGTVLFKGRDTTTLLTDRIISLGITLVPEGQGILTAMTIMENLELGAYHRKDDIRSSLEMVFDWFPILKDKKDQKAVLLSGGQQQMLAIGRALMASPDLIMMDEPSLGLAPILGNKLFDIIANIKKKQNTILLGEQNAPKALQVAGRGYVFDKGQVVLGGTNKELSENVLVRKAYFGG